MALIPWARQRLALESWLDFHRLAPKLQGWSVHSVTLRYKKPSTKSLACGPRHQLIDIFISIMRLLLTLFLLNLCPGLSWAGEAYSLGQLEAMASRESRAMLASREQVAAARAAVETAGAFPNPEVEWMQGSSQGRISPSPVTGQVRTIAVSQPLDLPHRRGPRIEAAEAALVAASATSRLFEADLIARLRIRFYDLLRREAEERAAREDKELMTGIRSRIALRVEVGEAPRYELVKADAEMLNAQKVAHSAGLRAIQARAALRALVGPQLPPDFSIDGKWSDIPKLSGLEEAQQAVLGSSAELGRVRAEKQKAERQLALERAQRWPSLALKAAMDQDPEIRSSRLGLALSLPIWDRRVGPVGEATAALARANHELAQQEFSLQQGLEAAYQQYEIALAQVQALESGIVRQAESALKIAEAAYRYGERGFLDVLDAQRVFRAARNELITARYELASAWAEIERLRTTP